MEVSSPAGFKQIHRSRGKEGRDKILQIGVLEFQKTL
jgi:hypothetical protein